MEDALSFEVVENNFLNKKTIEFLHRMVYWRYASLGFVCFDFLFNQLIYK